MGLGLCIRQVQTLQCSICRQEDGDISSIYYSISNRLNSPEMVEAFCIAVGVCPCCHRNYPFSSGQLPDPIIKRFIKFKKKQMKDEETGSAA